MDAPVRRPRALRGAVFSHVVVARVALGAFAQLVWVLQSVAVRVERRELRCRNRVLGWLLHRCELVKERRLCIACGWEEGKRDK